MSMPEFPKPTPDFTQEQALTMILSSIALEEVALSHIINAEGEKIQYVLNQTNCDGCSADLKDILAVNKSVTSLLEMVLQNQMVLRNKMERVLEYLPKPPSPPGPPMPPCPPGRPKPPCAPGSCCPPSPPPCPPIACRPKQSSYFDVIPKQYSCKEPLQWKENTIWGCFGLAPGDCSKIRMPCMGTFAADLYLDIGEPACAPFEVKMAICCEGKHPVVQNLCLEQHPSGGFMHQRAVIEIPRGCYPCYASFTICSPRTTQIRQGCVLFTKI